MLTWIYSVTLTLSHSKVLFSEESAIYLSASNRCVVFWSKENLFLQELVHAAPAMKLRLCAWTVLFQCHEHGIFYSSVGGVTWFRPRNRGLRWWDISTLRSFCAQCFERTLSRLLDYACFIDTMVPLMWPPYSPEHITMDRSCRVVSKEVCSWMLLYHQCRVAQSCGRCLVWPASRCACRSAVSIAKK